MTPTFCGGLRESSTSRLADPLHPLQEVVSSKPTATTGRIEARHGFDAPNHAPGLSVSACSALLRQGTSEGWNARSYHRIAACFDYTNPIAAGMWAGFARGAR